MPQSLSSVFLHIVFSTKNRHPFFADPEVRADVHSYLGGISNRLGCQSLLVGGVEDHVHILARQSRTISLADWIRDLKANSSTWMKGRGGSSSQFAWQSGYGAFSVEADRNDRVIAYIREQDVHHRKVSFQEEFRQLLKEHGMEWDERYVWD